MKDFIEHHIKPHVACLLPFSTMCVSPFVVTPLSIQARSQGTNDKYFVDNKKHQLYHSYLVISQIVTWGLNNQKFVEFWERVGVY